MKAVAKKHGFDFAELASAKGKLGKSAPVVRFRDPEDSSRTWTGRGRKPNWLVEALDSGKPIEHFAI